MNNKLNRRNFLKISALTGGGLVIGLPALNSCTNPKEAREAATSWTDVNAFLKIANNGEVTIKSPNPEIGQGVKTSMPMVVAEELDIPWEMVTVVQAPLDLENYKNQWAGGSQSIKRSWNVLRMAGATARFALISAAANMWSVPVSELVTEDGKVLHKASNQSAHYGELLEAAASVEAPEEVKLKDPKDFKLIGTDVKNVEMANILTGKPLFGLDYKVDGMLYARVIHPPAFGATLASVDDAAAKAMSGIAHVVKFGEKVAVVGKSSWEVIKAANALKVTWNNPPKPESTEGHVAEMRRLLGKKGEVRRKDGNPERAFRQADKVIEASYEAPFLPHNTLEPMNFFAHVTENSAKLVGPTQTPERAMRTAMSITGLKEDQVTVEMTRMGGGFGRRLYADFVTDAVEISHQLKLPIKVIYTREDDMTAGTYRPAFQYKFRAALDKDGQLTAYHQRGVSVNGGHVTRDLNIPSGAVGNVLLDSHVIKSEITTGAWRSPTHNFLGFAEQSFIDEVAHAAGKDPLQFRLDMLENAKNNPVGEVKYDPERCIGVLKLAAEKAAYGKAPAGVFQGVALYFSHSTYVAQVAELVMEEDKPKIKRIVTAVDCGIVVNPTGAINQVQGSILDGIGHTFFGALSFKGGKPEQNNFNQYRLIRIPEVPNVEVHFVKNTLDPTGLGEPALNPAPAAVGNALFAATGERWRVTPLGADKKPGVVELEGRVG
ncbi:MAG: molybdopterin-dependent oxidoreductase [Bacteroidia bacterium]|nr:molybdopterin-dependent oxidoreductase [Bacteroidia bacterium]